MRGSLLVVVVLGALAAPISVAHATAGANPFADATFFVDPDSNAAQEAADDPANAAIWNRIAGNAQADWFGDWYPASDVARVAADRVRTIRAAGALPVFVVYAIPQRDCGGYSSGGTNSPSSYRTWLDRFASGLGEGEVVVILEPDALAMLDCLSGSDRQTRLALLNWAVDRLDAQGDVTVYLDAGHSRWASASTMAQRLTDAGVARARGFSLNVSNHQWTGDEVAYGTDVSDRIGGRPFVIDTSRNGLGPSTDPHDPEPWCNAPGRALGTPPTARTGDPRVDAFLWVKRPGESDGTCKGGPSAGTWWRDHAFELARASSGVSPTGILDGDPATTERVDTSDPTAAAISVSRDRFPASRSAEYVILSRGDVFSDSLAASGLSSGGPLLFTDGHRLTAASRDELVRVLADGRTVYLLGGPVAIGQEVHEAVEREGYRVERLAGETRVETSVAIATEIRRRAPGVRVAAVSRAFGASADQTDAWVDSIAAGGWAASRNVPILVTHTDQLDAPARRWLDEDGPSTTYLLGGPHALSGEVARQAPEPERIAGDDRAGTAVRIAERLWGVAASGERRFVVINGYATRGWAFGLAGAGAAQRYDAPILVVHDEVVHDITARMVSSCGPARVDLLLMGDTSVISAGAREQLDARDGGSC